jgi:hypothetical protein
VTRNNGILNKQIPLSFLTALLHRRCALHRSNDTAPEYKLSCADGAAWEGLSNDDCGGGVWELVRLSTDCGPEIEPVVCVGSFRGMVGELPWIVDPVRAVCTATGSPHSTTRVQSHAYAEYMTTHRCNALFGGDHRAPRTEQEQVTT